MAKLCAGREKDIAWLRAAFGAGLLDRNVVEDRLTTVTDPRKPEPGVRRDRLAAATP